MSLALVRVSCILGGGMNGEIEGIRSALGRWRQGLNRLNKMSDEVWREIADSKFFTQVHPPLWCPKRFFEKGLEVNIMRI